ncbi:hypothetical protein CVT26_004347 [Gymnopilus dilepis]|uniref:Hydrophobin n=1 Tax=Gymnopilus dilepis TaxID=231916 RepID=A0A409W2A0_9AGAR|nr:hypothetical protein CVT26_004347 [Gymnopilus dilepis]
MTKSSVHLLALLVFVTRVQCGLLTTSPPCDTGELECCSSLIELHLYVFLSRRILLIKNKASQATALLALLGFPIPAGITGLVGFGCTAAGTTTGVGPIVGNCPTQLACCTGLLNEPAEIAFDCIPFQM